jgi:hypothetical protein
VAVQIAGDFTAGGTHPNVLVVEAGTLSVDGTLTSTDPAPGSNTPGLTVLAGSSATLGRAVVDTLDVQGPVTINGASPASVVGDLILDPASYVNLNDAMVIGTETPGETRAALIAGLNIASGYWDGTAQAIQSSSAANDGTALTALGYMSNDLVQLGSSGAIYTDWEGVSGLEADDMLVKYTYYGDADLSGSIDTTDYFLIDSNFASATPVGEWLFGDFDYSGTLDTTDYFLIDSGFANQGAPMGGGAAAVPEPGTVLLLVLGGLFVMAGRVIRRRRR